MVGVVRILAGIAPGDVHFAGCQVDHYGIDGFLAVERVIDILGVIADRVRVVDMVTLDGLQCFDGMLVFALDQSQGAVVAHALGDQIFGLTFHRLHGWREIMVGMYNIPVLAIQDAKMARRDFHGI